MKKDKIYRITIEERQENNKYKELDKFNTNCSIISNYDEISIMANKVDASDIIDMLLNIIDVTYNFIKDKIDLSYDDYIKLIPQILLDNKNQISIDIDIKELINQILNNDNKD